MNNKLIRIIFNKPKTFKKDESFVITTHIKKDGLSVDNIKDDKGKNIPFHIEPELVFIDEIGIIDPKVWERLNKVIKKISETTTISFFECANAFKQASFDSDHFIEGCKRMNELSQSRELTIEDKPVKKSYDSFINKPIGKQRRSKYSRWDK